MSQRWDSKHSLSDKERYWQRIRTKPEEYSLTRLNHEIQNMQIVLTSILERAQAFKEDVKAEYAHREKEQREKVQQAKTNLLNQGYKSQLEERLALLTANKDRFNEDENSIFSFNLQLKNLLNNLNDKTYIKYKYITTLNKDGYDHIINEFDKRARELGILANEPQNPTIAETKEIEEKVTTIHIAETPENQRLQAIKKPLAEKYEWRFQQCFVSFRTHSLLYTQNKELHHTLKHYFEIIKPLDTADITRFAKDLNNKNLETELLKHLNQAEETCINFRIQAAEQKLCAEHLEELCQQGFMKEVHDRLEAIIKCNNDFLKENYAPQLSEYYSSLESKMGTSKTVRNMKPDTLNALLKTIDIELARTAFIDIHKNLCSTSTAALFGIKTSDLDYNSSLEVFLACAARPTSKKSKRACHILDWVSPSGNIFTVEEVLLKMAQDSKKTSEHKNQNGR